MIDDNVYRIFIFWILKLSLVVPVYFFPSMDGVIYETAKRSWPICCLDIEATCPSTASIGSFTRF